MKNIMLKAIISLGIVCACLQSNAAETRENQVICAPVQKDSVKMKLQGTPKGYVPMIFCHLMDESVTEYTEYPVPKEGEKFYYDYGFINVNRIGVYYSCFQGLIYRANEKPAYLGYYLFFKEKMVKNTHAPMELSCNIKVWPDDKNVKVDVEHIYDITSEYIQTPHAADEAYPHAPIEEFDKNLENKLKYITKTKNNGARFEEQSSIGCFKTYGKNEDIRFLKHVSYSNIFQSQDGLCNYLGHLSNQMSLPGEVQKEFKEKFCSNWENNS